MFLFAVRTYIRSIETNGYALDFAFFSMFSRHAITLALSDFVLVLSTGLCVPFAKAISKGWIRYHWLGLVLQHVWQTVVLMVAVKWTFNRSVGFSSMALEFSQLNIVVLTRVFFEGIGRGSSQDI